MPYAAAAGAVLGSWLLVGVPLALAVALAAVCVWRPSPLMVLVVFAAFAGFFGARALEGLADPPHGPVEGWVTLLDDPRPLGVNGVRVTVRHGDARLEARAYGAVAARLDDALAGERVHITGTARPAAGDWHRWRHVASTLSVDTVGDRAGAAPVAAFANRLRRLLASGVSSLPDDSRAMFSGMVYGDDRDQSPRLADDFRAAGLGHLLVVSGQNVAFVLALASPVLARARPGVRLVALLALLGVFALLTRFEPSVLRAVAMAGTAVTSAALGRPETGRRTLAWAVATVLVIDPFLVRVLAFQLSVCATCGLLWITPALAERLRGPRPLRLAVATTAGAQLAVMPLLVAVFGTVPLASLPANVLAAPASGPVMMWGLTGGVAAGMFGGQLAWLMHRPTAVLLWWIRSVAAGAAAAPPMMLGVAGAVVVGSGVALVLLARGLEMRRARAGAGRAGGMPAASDAGTLARRPLRAGAGRAGGLPAADGFGVGRAADVAAADAGPGTGRATDVGAADAGGGAEGVRVEDVGGLDAGRAAGAGTADVDGMSGGRVLNPGRVLGVAGLALVAAAVGYSVLAAASPPAGWSEVGGARLWRHDSVMIVVLDQPSRPARLLESLRMAGVRRADLVVAARGGASDAHAVLALRDRYREAAVVAPPMHRVPGARTVRAGAVVQIGDVSVEVVGEEPQLDVVVTIPRGRTSSG